MNRLDSKLWRIAVMSTMVIMLVLSSINIAIGDNSKTLDEVLTDIETDNTEIDSNEDGGTTRIGSANKSKNSNFLDGLSEASDLTADVDGASDVAAFAKTVISFIVQVLAYVTTALLSLRVVLDLIYIGLPFSRGILGNGAGGAMPQAGMAGMGGMGMGGMGMNPMANRGRYGMNRYGGMGGFGGMGMNSGMGMNTGMGAQRQAGGGIQWISNSALNAVSAETMAGPDGKSMSPFRIYAKDMVVVLVMTPIMLTLAVTGVLTTLGLQIGNIIVEGLRNLRIMM